MAFKVQTPEICLVVVVLVVCWSGVSGQSGCTTELTSLYPCLNYVSGNSSSPSPTCCSQLAGVVRSQPRCLCLLLNGGASSVGLNVNDTLALSLPDKCNVQAPPASRCSGSSPPAGSTTPANSGSNQSQTPGVSQTPASVTNTPAVSKTFPSIDGSASAGSNLRASFLLVGFFLLVASGVISGATH